ncbi:6-phosphofructokinase [Fluviibacter phosphoraccumulans]|uniref:Pyrophosphate--fructose 6-phosphate 1-phosphotransferase n=1 Tax=Fluviibacter phosphoraccumulans TaxID=1751046 RepID=A0A7R6REV8_9RHOO|nr:6-phosphofructokinase [Fluviibacter phosphoraccumulans]BBU69771.1 pyrophosphate--fructose 6-phosphate 1-phosphotransferase [Fluviibacter phosphoraccumulans]BBU71046.1 pyrophosphate--fructose 6-phosphate 1-phosphotransferase [Fluviibacter phosphoraccumulans]
MKNALYFQSGGVTAVIGATAAALIEAHQRQGQGTLYAAENGLSGLLDAHLVNASALPPAMRQALSQIPGGGLGSGRTLLQAYEDNPEQWQRVRDVLLAHEVGTIYVNGGNGSMDTAAKLVELGQRFNLPLKVIGLPKTIDNDLEGTDTSPGFGSALKYLSVSLMEAARDHCAMATKPSVFILEVMGRHTGWLATCGAVARLPAEMASPLILFPEVVFDPERFVQVVQASFKTHKACICVVSEGIRTADGQFYAQQNTASHYGHEQLGGAGFSVASLLRAQLGVKVHVAVPDYLQRAARHLASATDIAQAEAVAQHAVQLAEQGQSGVMVNIVRDANTPYAWHCDSIPLTDIANRERLFPTAWIDQNAYSISADALAYLQPLIQGEQQQHWHEGLPNYPWVSWPKVCVTS